MYIFLYGYESERENHDLSQAFHDFDMSLISLMTKEPHFLTL